MAVTIPRLNSQTKASKTPAVKTAVSADIGYIDTGLDDVATGLLKDLGDAALVAQENEKVGISNATFQEIRRRCQDEYDNAVNSKDYRGYNAKDFMKVMREKYDKIVSDVSQNGFTRRDGVTVPALSKEDFNQRVTPRIDVDFMRRDSEAMNYAKSEMAIAEQNDFEVAIENEILDLAKTSDPIVQATISNTLDGLKKAFYRGRLSDSARAASVAADMNKGLTTYLKNLAATDPARAIHEAKTNDNFSTYGVDTASIIDGAIESMAEMDGLNRAFEINGMETLPQNWTDQAIPEKGATEDETLRLSVFRKTHPYAASTLMTPQQYAKYRMKAANVYTAKKAAIADELRAVHRDRDISIMKELSEANTASDVNKVIEAAAERGDRRSMATIKAVNDTKDALAVYENDVNLVSLYSTPEGEFNEDAANIAFTAWVEQTGAQYGSERELQLDRIKFSTQRAIEFQDAKDRIAQANENAVMSSHAFDAAANEINSSVGPRRVQDVENFEIMTPQDKAAIVDMLMDKARTDNAVATIQRNEGDSFDLTELAKKQWTDLGNKTKIGEDGKVKTSDVEAFNRFNSRFRELYIKAYQSTGGKLNSEQLREIGLDAFNTYAKPVMYNDVKSLSAKINKTTVNAFTPSHVDEVTRRAMIKQTLENGRFRLPEVPLANVDMYATPTYARDNAFRIAAESLAKRRGKEAPNPALQAVRTFTDKDTFEGLKKVATREVPRFSSIADLSDEEEDLLDSVVEVYDELDYNDKETLVDIIATGNNSALLRILKAKGKI